MNAVVGALQKALAAEHVAVYGYGVVGAELRGERRRRARVDWAAHRADRDGLRRLLRDRGARPTPAASAYDLPAHADDRGGDRDAARLATRLEEGVTAAYAGLVAAGDSRLRRFAARAMGDSAVRAAYWRGSPVPFPGLRESAGRPHKARSERPSALSEAGDQARPARSR